MKTVVTIGDLLLLHPMNKRYATTVKLKTSYFNDFFQTILATRHYAAVAQPVKPSEHKLIAHSDVLRLSNFIQQLCNPDSTTFAKEARATNKFEKAHEQSAINYWSSMEFPANTDAVPDELLNEFKQHTKQMSTGTLVQLLQVMGEKNVRHEDLLANVCERLQKIPSFGIGLLALTISALSRLTYLDAKLITTLKQTFLNILEEQYNNPHIYQNSIIAINAFGRLHLNDQRFWLKIIQWVESNSEHSQSDSNREGNVESNCLNIGQIVQCTQAFALVNIDNERAEKVTSELVRRINTANYKPRVWLSIMHQLAVLKALTPRLAESVLCEVFLKALHERHESRTDLNEHTILYDNIRLLNISNAARFDLANYGGPLMTNKILQSDKKQSELVRQVKFGTIEPATLSTFDLLLRLIVPHKSHSTGPELDHRIGAVLESRCYVDPLNHKFVPLNEGTMSKDCKEVAILYFLDTHLTRVFDENEAGEPRLLGTHQMVVRHLKSIGVHPVVFTESELCAFGNDETRKANHVRQRILGLCEKWHTNKWTIMDAMDSA